MNVDRLSVNRLPNKFEFSGSVEGSGAGELGLPSGAAA